MQTHKTNRFGTLEYDPKETVTFPDGLIGYSELRRFLIRTSRRTEPVRWLISLEESLEFPMTLPAKLYPDYPPEKAIGEAREALGQGRLWVYALLVLPKDLTKATINLRTPIFINDDTKTGLHYSGSALSHQPLSVRVYRELFGKEK